MPHLSSGKGIQRLLARPSKEKTLLIEAGRADQLQVLHSYTPFPCPDINDSNVLCVCVRPRLKREKPLFSFFLHVCLHRVSDSWRGTRNARIVWLLKQLRASVLVCKASYLLWPALRGGKRKRRKDKCGGSEKLSFKAPRWSTIYGHFPSQTGIAERSRWALTPGLRTGDVSAADRRFQSSVGESLD